MMFSFLQVSPELLRLHCRSRLDAIKAAGLNGTADALLPEEFITPWSEQILMNPDWLGFWVIFEDQVIGSGGYKKAPEAGMVEIGYGIHEPFWGRGAATGLCEILTKHAFRLGVDCVRAHTLADGFASQKVLSRNGFAMQGEVIEPEDGLVLRWERREA